MKPIRQAVKDIVIHWRPGQNSAPPLTAGMVPHELLQKKMIVVFLMAAFWAPDLGALLTSGLVWCRTGPVSGKDLTEMPTVLSVSRLSQRLDETPGAVTLLDMR